MIGFTGIGFAPLIDWRIIAAAGAIALILLIFGLFRRARGSLIRMFALGVLALALLNPDLEAENRRSQPDMAVVMVDESSSQNTGGRRQQLKAAAIDPGQGEPVPGADYHLPGGQLGPALDNPQVLQPSHLLDAVARQAGQDFLGMLSKGGRRAGRPIRRRGAEL